MTKNQKIGGVVLLGVAALATWYFWPAKNPAANEKETKNFSGADGSARRIGNPCPPGYSLQGNKCVKSDGSRTEFASGNKRTILVGPLHGTVLPCPDGTTSTGLTSTGANICVTVNT